MFKRLLLIGFIALIPVLLFAKKEALIVAVGKYKDPSIRRLHVGHDIVKMEYLLEKQGFHLTILKNYQATYYNVVKQLKSYQKLSSNDVFVFYDTSHGVQIPDLNHDESDGKDEAFALYDVSINNAEVSDVKGLLVDDELNFLLNKIPAKKLIIIDACHSGSIHKSLSIRNRAGYTTKTLNRSVHFYNSRKTFFKKKYNKRVNNLVVLSASKDDELSIDNPESGGLFTDTLYKVWDKNPNISFKELTYKSSQIIQRQHFANLKPQQPQIYSTNNQENTDINLYLQDVESYLDMLVKRCRNKIYIKSKQSTYYLGESISFKINTYNRMGHLYILNIGKKITKIFPNHYSTSSQIVSTNFTFPSKNFDIKAEISSRQRKEKTIAYAILSDKPVAQLENNSIISFNILKKIFKNSNGKISISKSDFLVIR